MLAGLTGLLLALLPASPASAHVGGGPEPTNWASVVTAVSPVPEGVSITVTPDGERLRATVTGDGELAVPGYSDEPYLLIDADGVRRNVHSPATYLNVSLSGDTELPPQADPSLPPDWERVSTAPAFEWHDHRTHWMGEGLPPEVTAEPGAEHLIATWTVPLTYDGVELTVTGTLTWFPPPSSLPYTLLVVVLAVGAVAVAGRERWQRPLMGLLAVAVVAEVVHLAVAVFVSSYSLLASCLPAAVAAVLTWAGWRSVRAGTTTPAYVGGMAAWLVLLAALSDVGVLTNSQLPSAGPDLLTRGSVALTLGLGLGVALACVRVLIRHRHPEPAAT